MSSVFMVFVYFLLQWVRVPLFVVGNFALEVAVLPLVKLRRYLRNSFEVCIVVYKDIAIVVAIAIFNLRRIDGPGKEMRHCDGARSVLSLVLL